VRRLEQLDVLMGEWAVASKKYPEGRGRTTVRPTEDGKFVRVDPVEPGKFDCRGRVITVTLDPVKAYKG